jgi:hypothetical protein
MNTRVKNNCGTRLLHAHRYQEREISRHDDWEYICGYLGINKKTISGLEILSDGFLLFTKNLH